MNKIYIEIYTVFAFIFLSFMVSLISYRKMAPQFLRLFPWFLLTTFLVEVGAFAYSSYTRKSNGFIFNLYQLLMYLFYFFIFSKSVTSAKLARIVQSCAIAFVAFYFFNILFWQGFKTLNSFTIAAGNVLTILCCLLYLAELFIKEDSVDYFSIPMFWITTGILFFSLGDSIYMGLFNYITSHNLDHNGAMYLLVMTILNILLYGLISVGLLCARPWKKIY